MSATIAVAFPTPTVSAAQTEHLDSRFTVLQATIKGSKGELQANEVVELCISYIPSTTFSSIPRFLHYFQEKDVLPLSVGQPLEIRDLSLLFRLQTEDPEILPDGIGQKCLFILNKILALVARTCVFKGEGLASSVTISSEAFSIQFPSDFILEAQRESVTIRPRHLFQMMDAYGVSQLSFAPDQPLQLVGVTEEEQQFETPDTANLQKWVRYAPQGCEINWLLKQGLFSYSRGQLNGWYGISQPQRAFIVQAPKGMTLSLTRPLSIVAIPAPLSAVSVVRITEDMALQGNFVFHDKNAIVVIERNLTGPGKKVSIVARNVIVCPNARLEVGELDIRTEGAALLLNVTADAVRLVTKGDAVLGNSRITSTKINSGKKAALFGLNWHTAVDLREQYAAIASVLEDAILLDARRFLPEPPQPFAARLEAPEAPAKKIRSSLFEKTFSAER